MSRNANNIPTGGGKRFTKEVLKPDGYLARVVGLVFVGVQNQRPYLGQEKPPVDELRITYELSTEFMKDEDGELLADKPRWLTETIPFKSLKLDKAKSSKRYSVLDVANANDGDFKALLGSPCTLVVTNNPGKGQHAGKVFENVGDVTPAPNLPGYVQPELVNPTFYYDPQDDGCTLEEFRSQPEFIQEIVMGANDFSTSVLATQIAGENGQPVADAPKPSADETTGDDDQPY
jgi:hypothetical protein